MKSSHVALVVSALAMTASGVSIGHLPPSPTKVSHSSTHESGRETQPITRRRPARGPLARTHKRAKISKNLSREEDTDSNANIENQLPTFEEYIKSFPRESNRSLHLPSARPKRVNPKLVQPNSASKATTSIPTTAHSSDIPGFVDIALPDLNAGLARTVSGLAYSMNSAIGSGELELGTSATHSTQFFMSPIKNRPGTSLYRLRVPVMDSTTFQSVDHCATFPISPAGPLSLKKCGMMPGFSQTFSYDTASGELQPVYHDDSSSSLAANDQNVPSRQHNKRQFYRDSNCEPALAPLSKRDGSPSPSPSPSPSSAVLYFVPAEGVKTGAYLTPQNSNQ
ncbi:hypothetical protein MJO28_011613 [Puccinia striiformis f. sp. tritici]|uniref:Uncharacterized protein n=2 Tax=Puccinia striiformis f. sp. tritici TaxID=168172 RepID=A0A0L0VPM1_9BASI|nr:hypothetical protein Pst134EA_021208 [Puccinia striiformis f. sp. tritici]KAI9624495.1 hypothetical protein KEM48_008820 [Puccinia striiformis f. sp. tritici PST-130]KNF01224.1 hypothetical protein PSTG_05581 [Puccinia striiformis f. sp. tritici PST-78]KAH9448052.1 hypothetical protein Pst134EB_022039 [Puccinia striiformis f. sp. tritici]KAH9457324.1 hypothetical protein Pst134EA_021208 [Puccinia striiformis f. sp. tritici]KAI7944085.1 hypothetical protein MJO28_011613 [Puccinia striiformis